MCVRACNLLVPTPFGVKSQLSLNPSRQVAVLPGHGQVLVLLPRIAEFEAIQL